MIPRPVRTTNTANIIVIVELGSVTLMGVEVVLVELAVE
jgi:hypothetical protein